MASHYSFIVSQWNVFHKNGKIIIRCLCYMWKIHQTNVYLVCPNDVELQSLYFIWNMATIYVVITIQMDCNLCKKTDKTKEMLRFLIMRRKWYWNADMLLKAWNMIFFFTYLQRLHHMNKMPNFWFHCQRYFARFYLSFYYLIHANEQK